MSESTVSVLGSASVPIEPDELDVVLEITQVDSTPDAALEDVTRRGDAVRALLDELGVPRESRSTEGQQSPRR